MNVLSESAPPRRKIVTSVGRWRSYSALAEPVPCDCASSAAWRSWSNPKYPAAPAITTMPEDLRKSRREEDEEDRLPVPVLIGVAPPRRRGTRSVGRSSTRRVVRHRPPSRLHLTGTTSLLLEIRGPEDDAQHLRLVLGLGGLRQALRSAVADVGADE